MPHRITWSWYTGRWWVGWNYIWYIEDGPGWAGAPPRPLLAVPNVTAHPSTTSVGLPITVLLYNGPLFCSFNVPIEGPDMRCLPTLVRPSSDVHCPSNDHISKTKQDRPIVTMEPYGSWYRWFCCHIYILSQTPKGDILVLNKKIFSNINKAFCSICRLTIAVVNRARPSSHRSCCQLGLLSTECDHRNLLLTIVRYVENK